MSVLIAFGSDGKYMCQLCLHVFPIEELNTLLGGGREDVCMSCAREEAVFYLFFVLARQRIYS